MLKMYGDQIKLESGINRGVSFARNRGTELSTGGYIQYLDSDDLLAPGTLDKRVSALRITSADVAYTDWQKFDLNVDGSMHRLEKIARSMESVNIDPQIACATSFWAPPVALLYRRNIVNAIGGWNEELPIIQDARFLFDAAHKGAEFVRVPGIGAYYRTANIGSLSKKNEYKFVLDVLHNANQIQELWLQETALTERRKLALIGIYDYAARVLFQHDEENFMAALGRLRLLGMKRSMRFTTAAGSLTELFGIRLARKMMGTAQALKKSLRN